jgi:hypothetical protein
MVNTMTEGAVWTQEQPTRAGWYWMRVLNDDADAGAYTVLLEVYPYGDHTFRINDLPLEDITARFRPYWHGPLVPPMGPR